jgi:hypothetical protein
VRERGRDYSWGEVGVRGRERPERKFYGVVCGGVECSGGHFEGSTADRCLVGDFASFCFDRSDLIYIRCVQHFVSLPLGARPDKSKQNLEDVSKQGV